MKSKRAKVLHQAGGMSLIEHVVRTARRVTAPDRIVAVLGHQAEQVQALLRPTGIRFAYQTEQRGTGHAVMACRELLEHQGGLVAVLYGDTPLLSAETLERLVAHQRREQAAATLITMTLEDPTGYGRIIRDAEWNVHAIVEQKAATPEQLAIREVNSGMYCFRADLLWKHLNELSTDNPAGEYYLTDMARILRDAGHTVAPMRLEDPSELLGINTRAELAEVDRLLRARKARELMLAGVTIEKPETVVIDEGVRVGMDTIVEPFAQIRGNTVIGEDCRIGACSIIEDSHLADRVVVLPFTSIGTSTIDADAQIGPYARLRGGSHVEAGARVGNFVELKKTRLGAGAKSMHLAYLGDSDIGERSNIGAGTITCNYDGVAKHPTKIGKHAFIGSNATLVAPVEVGDGSYIGAGSVITDPVPPGALALGRGRQVVKEGWVVARKKKKSPPRHEDTKGTVK